MSRVLPPVGGFNWEEFRGFRNDTRPGVGAGGGKFFVDGDVVESFLDLSQSEMERVVQDMKKGSWHSKFVKKIKKKKKKENETNLKKDAEEEEDDLTVNFVKSYVQNVILRNT
mgnify:FL=1